MTRHAQLNNIDHAGVKIRTERSAALGDAIMSCPVYPQEFRSLQAYYPIVFSRKPEHDTAPGTYRPLALFGLEQGSNVFLDGERWEADYIPLRMRIQPFLIGVTPPGEGEQKMEVHLDLDHPRVSQTDGLPVFLDHGGHSDFLKDVVELLGHVHGGEAAMPGFTRMLDDLELVEPFSLDVALSDGTNGRLAGLYTLNEEKLYALDGETLGRLQEWGMLQPLFMVVASLSQFRPLIERRNRQGVS